MVASSVSNNTLCNSGARHCSHIVLCMVSSLSFSESESISGSCRSGEIACHIGVGIFSQNVASEVLEMLRHVQMVMP